MRHECVTQGSHYAAAVDTRDAEVAALLERLLEELRALREESARQSALLEAILAKLDAIERTQYS